MPDQSPDSENLDTRQRRAIYRASHRGTKELDLILGPFAVAHVGGFSSNMLTRFELLLENEETQLQHWLIGDGEIPSDVDGELLQTIRNYQRARAGILTQDKTK